MIVVARPVGQLANRLFQYAHFVAFAADTGITVANPGLGTHADAFPAFARDALCRYPEPRRKLPAALRSQAAIAAAVALRASAALPRVHAFDVADTEVTSLEVDPFRRLAERSALLLAAGWQLRAYGAFARHRDELRRVFTPAPQHLAASAAAVARARRAAPLVVGVHRRRGDYAGWREGRYLYDDEQYAAVMERMQALLGGEVAFLVCSDEPVPDQAFAGFAVLPGPGRPVEDLYALSMCDRLLGPPSTFGSWASFVGEVSRYEITDPGAEFSLEDLRIWGWG